MFIRLALLVVSLSILESSTPPANAILKLQEKIDSGAVKLHFGEKHGYLESLLKELKHSG